MKYFFTLAYAGLDKNGNSRYHVTGFHMGNQPQEFVTLNKVFMQEVIGGRWSDKSESVTTQKSIQQIVEKLRNKFNDDFAFAIV